jgi:DNA-binding protein HU-beta
MNVSDMVDEIASDAELTKAQVRRAIPVIFDAIYKALGDGQEIKLGSIGKLTVVMRGPTTAWNFNGETVKIPERRVVKFKPFDGMKEFLNPKKKPVRRTA